MQALRNLRTRSSNPELLLTAWGCGKSIPHVPERQQNGTVIPLPQVPESSEAEDKPALLTLIGYVGVTELSLLSVRVYVRWT